MSLLLKYFEELQKLFQTERAREHAYRPALHNLLNDLNKDETLRILNDPARSEYGAPDFIILKKDLPIGYIETKDLDADLDKAETSAQLERYFGYSNLILTNYLEFRFFKNGEKVETIKLGSLNGNSLYFNSTELETLENELIHFITGRPDSIKNGLQLAKIMGGHGRRIRDNVRHFLNTESDSNQELEKIYEVIKKLLIHDLTKEKFADMYAQTLVYGLFIARYHDKSTDNFTRAEARDLVPDSNPFLKTFFDHIAGNSFDKRLAYIVNELCEVFSFSDVKAIMQQYTKQLALFDMGKELPDPVIHFYEDFLKEYDSKQRIALGVFYTPLPVVRFIVRSIDELLKKEFGLDKGLSDTSKIERNVTRQGQRVKETLHRVQILDPATGTGTFLNEVISQIHTNFEGQEGRWKSYVNDDLLPRIHGFELMIASYTIAHLKLGLNLANTGYKEFNRRIGVYLTNSLEDSVDIDNTLFASIGLPFAISKEAEAADIIKNKKPIMVVLGNPPYSGVSSNNTKYANSLVDKYKVEPGGKQKLQERKHWLNDDYVKFIAFAEDMIAKNKDGIIGFITNHGYLDNPTFRGMRWHLLDTFDSIYIIDLHGNSRKKEISPDGSQDENVFDIQTGVSIMLAIKTGKKKNSNFAKVYRTDIWGKREIKFIQLDKLNFKNINWNSIDCRLPNLVFAESGSIKIETEYRKGFSISELFVKNSTGIVTMGDGFIVDENKNILEKRVENLLNEDISEKDLTQKFNLGKNYAIWILQNKKKISNNSDKIVSFAYRPFDNRYTYFDNKLVWRPRTETMKHFIIGENVGLIAKRGFDEYNSAPVFISNKINESRSWSRAGMEGIESIFPLYLYFEDGSKVPNFKKEIINRIEQIIGKATPENIFDYIYAVLHSPNYREKYKEFLKIDFPRVPYPKNAEQFKKLVEKGKELRELHLLESTILNNLTTTYPIEGTDKVEKIEYKDNKVFINNDQYFGNVPEIAWNFYIGGYQPAQKWLKDRKERTLSSEDIEHYQKIIVALVETDRIMKEIDEIMVME